MPEEQPDAGSKEQDVDVLDDEMTGGLFAVLNLSEEEKSKVRTIADAVVEPLSGNGVPTEREVEAVMRPFVGLLSYRVRLGVEILLGKREKTREWNRIFAWTLVNFVVFGSGEKHTSEIETFLGLYSGCGCYPEYLATAIELATDPVDERVVALLEEEG